MKNFGRALLLLTLGLVLMSQAAMAQDALSAVLPAPYTTRVGSQLMYFYEDGANLGARGSFQSFLTIVNTNITTGVWVHFQFYQVTQTSSSGCLELFDFVDYLTPGQRHIIDPKGVRGTFYLTNLVGFATDGRYVMTATPILVAPSFIAPTPADLRAVSFNYLSGQIWVSDIGKSATWMTNAVPRMAVDILGGPLGDNVILDGVVTYLQMFRPIVLAVNSFFRTAGAGAVQPGVPFGNRLTLWTWIDQYTNPQLMYRQIIANATLNTFVFDNAENAFSVPPRTITCVYEFVIAPDTIGTTGNWPDFLGAALTSAVNNTGGWMRMRVASYVALQNILGWFSQYLGTFGGGDYLIGIGRVQQGALTIQTTDGTGVLTTPKTTTTF
jgi:hypothetical protein